MEFTEEATEQIMQMGFDAQSQISYTRAMHEEQERQDGQLLAICLISLAVSAIGVANTMYASVLERRWDIGIMKVPGTSPREIRGLYLAEAGIVGLGGDLLGPGASLIAMLFLHSGSFFGVWLKSGDARNMPFAAALIALVCPRRG